MSRFLVVVPLRDGVKEAALALVADGPPFDLPGTGLTSHSVYLTEREAIFVFEGPAPHSDLERIVGDPGVWRAAPAWRECMAGRPRLADEAFAWVREGSVGT